MKRKTLLSIATSMMIATSLSAQVDCTPANWKFDTMQKGSAQGLFIKEAAAIGGNFQKQTLEDGRQGFRYADNLQGGFAVAHWTGEADCGYNDLTEQQKADFQAFYDAFQIADGGDLGNVLIYQGNSSTETDNRAVKNTVGMSSPGVYVVTQKDLQTGTYKVTIPVRMIVNADLATAKMNTYLGTSWWDGVPLAGSGQSGYANFTLESIPDFNQYWTSYSFEVEVTNNSDPKYDFTPVLIKLGLDWNAANGTILIFDDFKIEKVSAPTLGGQLKVDAVDWDDTPAGGTGIGNVEKKDNIIVFTNTNGIVVVDATEKIEVYNATGMLVASKLPNNAATTIEVSEKGIYLVKTGNTTRKIIF